MDSSLEQHIRNLKLELIYKEIDIDKPKLNFFDRLKLGYSLLKELKSCGILVGSRALNCYHINGERILNRKLNDWDFIVDDIKFNDILNRYKIIPYKNGNFLYLNIERGIRILQDDYETDDTGINPFGLEFNIIKMSDNVPYKKVKGWKIANFNYLLEEKRKLSKINKNIIDLNNIINMMISNGFLKND